MQSKDTEHSKPGLIIEAMVTQLTTDQLKIAAEAHLEQLIEQGTKIVTMQSNLDLVMKRYRINTSYLGTLVDWFGQTPWWSKLLLGITVTTVSVVIGALFNAIALCACIGVGLYVATAFLLQNQFDVTATRDRLLAEDFLEIEAVLGQSVTELNALNGQLNEVLLSLCNQNIQLAKDTKDFELEIDALKNQNVHFNETLSQLENQKKELEAAKERLCTELNQSSDALKITQEMLNTKSKEIEEINDQLMQTNLKLAISTKQMAVLDEKLQQNLRNLSPLKESLQEQITLLKEYVVEYKRRTDEMVIELDSIVDTALDSHTNTDAVIAHADETLHSVALQLEQIQQKREQMDLQEQQMDKEMEQQCEEQSVLIARVEAQRLARQQRKNRNASFSDPQPPLNPPSFSFV